MYTYNHLDEKVDVYRENAYGDEIADELEEDIVPERSKYAFARREVEYGQESERQLDCFDNVAPEVEMSEQFARDKRNEQHRDGTRENDAHPLFEIYFGEALIIVHCEKGF